MLGIGFSLVGTISPRHSRLLAPQTQDASIPFQKGHENENLNKSLKSSDTLDQYLVCGLKGGENSRKY
jgi:hypothetical protein